MRTGFCSGALGWLGLVLLLPATFPLACAENVGQLKICQLSGKPVPETCEENGVFVEVGENCLKSVQDYIDAQGGKSKVASKAEAIRRDKSGTNNASALEIGNASLLGHNQNLVGLVLKKID